MPLAEQWQASLSEQRTAWGIAACCIILVFMASAKPEWFDFSSPQHSVPQPEKSAVQKTVVQKSTVHKPAVVQAEEQQETAPVTPPAKTEPAPSIAGHTPQIKMQTPKNRVPPKSEKAPATTSPSQPVPVIASIATGYYVQIGAFQRPHARKLADRLKKDGWKTTISARKNGLYAVWIGPKKTRASAGKLAKTIQRELKIKGFIVHQKNG